MERFQACSQSVFRVSNRKLQPKRLMAMQPKRNIDTLELWWSGIKIKGNPLCLHLLDAITMNPTNHDQSLNYNLWAFARCHHIKRLYYTPPPTQICHIAQHENKTYQGHGSISVIRISNQVLTKLPHSTTAKLQDQSCKEKQVPSWNLEINTGDSGLDRDQTITMRLLNFLNWCNQLVR